MTRKSFRERVGDTERKLVLRALAKTDGCIARAAKALALHPFQVRRLVERYQLGAHVKKAKRPPVFGGNAAWNALADA